MELGIKEINKKVAEESAFVAELKHQVAGLPVKVLELGQSFDL